MEKSGRAKAGIIAAGLAMGLSGCVSSIDETNPFVARLNQTPTQSGEEAEAPRTRGAFSLFGGAPGDAAKDGKAENPFKGLFAANTEAASNETATHPSNPFKGLFAKSADADGTNGADPEHGGSQGNPFKGMFAGAPRAEADDTSGQPHVGNPFKALFAARPDAEATQTEPDDEAPSGNLFAGLFKKRDTAADASAEATTRNGGLPLVGAGRNTPSQQDAQSGIITGLKARRSVLPHGSAYSEVAGAVLAANSRAAESELRAARLRAAAASQNWLPTVGPAISLSSLGDLVANLVVEQVLFDNGRKKAERAFAAADVEVAAVSLAEDTNMRVFTALDLYLTGEEGAEKAKVSQSAFNDMSRFEHIMDERVRGGVSNRSDLGVLRQKMAEIRSDMTLGRETKSAATAELNAMSIRDLSGVSGVPQLDLEGVYATPLPVLKAEAEKDRTIAEAGISRASNLPGLKATGAVGNGGSSAGLQIASQNLLGLGTGATLKAIEATKEGASRKVAQSREDSNRRLRALETNLKGTSRQFKEANNLAHQSKRNLDLFQAQYKAGTRQVMDVVSVYETYARQQQRAVTLKYKVARLELQIARELGLLADGASM